MAQAEAAFEILFLLCSAGLGIRLLPGRAHRRTGVTCLVLTLAWACRLIPRILSLLTEWDLSLWLGLGRLGWSVGTAVWLFLLFRLWERLFSPDVRDRLLFLICVSALLVRILALIPPENRWRENGFSPIWSGISCSALVIAGAVVTVLWFSARNRKSGLGQIWALLLIILLLEIPLATGLTPFPALRWLLLPQMLASLGLAAQQAD